MSALLRRLLASGALAVCCSEEKTVHFSPTEEARFIDRFSGQWALPDGSLKASISPRSASFCDEDACAGKPCRSMIRDGNAASLSYQSSDLACDCYGCECHDYRAGFAVTLTVEAAGCVRSVDALVASYPSGGASLEPVSGKKDPLRLASLASFGDSDALVVDAAPAPDTGASGAGGAGGAGPADPCPDALSLLASRAGKQGLSVPRVGP